MKKSISFRVDNFTDFKIQMLNWVNRFNIFCFLDNQQYDFSAPVFECLLAAGCKKNIEVQSGKAFDTLQAFYATEKNEWLFGHFGYYLKNDTEQLHSGNFDGIGFSDLHFFVPEIVLRLNNSTVEIFCEDDAAAVFNEILSFPIMITPAKPVSATVQNRISKEHYTAIIENLRQHILRGDCYEINFCQEFFAEDVVLDPLFVYHRLTAISPNPFAVFYKVEDKYCLCASPERYLSKKGDRIFSQPIKGTSKRDLVNAAQDEAHKQYLLQSSKEKSENVMVVDLVRNDLSRICVPGSVKVDELFGLYSFPQVHQMISTVSGKLREELNWIDCIKATFPMGSMTGAPKKKVMELIEQYEQTRRGLFSGAIGYIDPDGDFDFNVVIRTLLYNDAARYLSFQTGGGITFYSNATAEYAESLLKAEVINSILH